MMSLKLLLALALVAVVTGSQEFEVGARRRREVCAEHSNGCSIPGDLPFFYKNTFTPACDRHDMCYNCGSLLGYTKDQCDQYFLNNMLKICASVRRRRDTLSRKYRSTCTLTATVYYEGVHLAGASHFRVPGHTDPYCTTDLVRTCVP
ncbi:hypothetical protein C0Q70_19488 [Pomacea canaliculata]|uniref:Conodipine-M alpha chain n=1 Tax=Pomacea canaliculata TaxID=400727 RepID=A0A2T7NJH1_POMCA|nr:uncharacterized protein LOC112553362 [Pomacea canaliculata]PVD21315.1 hypothetical protein C0Q70_19488 [Pomacea canaliculata]